MITDYRLLSYNLPHNLEETVNNYIKQGWQPQGNLTHNGEEFYQVMVKEKENIIDEELIEMNYQPDSTWGPTL